MIPTKASLNIGSPDTNVTSFMQIVYHEWEVYKTKIEIFETDSYAGSLKR